MATTRRSVWEIRFYALKHTIENKIGWIKYDVEKTVLENEDSPKEEWIKSYKLYKELLVEAKKIETKQASEIFLLRDF